MYMFKTIAKIALIATLFPLLGWWCLPFADADWVIYAACFLQILVIGIGSILYYKRHINDDKRLLKSIAIVIGSFLFSWVIFCVVFYCSWIYSGKK